MVCSLRARLPASKGASYGGGRTFGVAVGQRTCVPHAYEGSSTATATSVESPPSAGTAGTIRVKVAPPRPTSAPPTPPSLIHSPVFVQKALIKPSADGAAVVSSPSNAGRLAERQGGTEDELEGRDDNSLLWALKQVDRSLDELEANPLPLQKEIYQLSRSPVGTATSSALTTAAKVTVAATREAVKAALPVGQWVVKEGAKAAFSLVSKAMAESARQQQQSGGTTKIVVKKAKK